MHSTAARAAAGAKAEARAGTATPAECLVAAEVAPVKAAGARAAAARAAAARATIGSGNF